MIASVAGEVAVRRADHVVVETAGGVGYRLAVSAETLRHVPPVGGSISLLAHLVVREDAMALYGFASEEERDLFELLAQRRLAHELLQPLGPQRAVEVLVSEQRRGRLDPVAHARALRRALARISSAVSPSAPSSRRSASPGS